MGEVITTIPRVGETLRFLITSLGLRPRGDDPKHAENTPPLDILAREQEGADLCVLERQVVTDLLVMPIKALCGRAWSGSAMMIASGLLGDFREMAKEFDVGILPPEQGRKIMQAEYLFPMATDVLRALHADHGGPRLDEFIRFPFRAWCCWEKVTCLCDAGHRQVKVRDHFGVDDTTFAKWTKGEKLKTLTFFGENAFKLSGKDPDTGNAWNATAWLMIARLLQAIPETVRAEIVTHLNPGKRKGPDGFTRLFHALDAAMDLYSTTEMKFVEWDPIAKSLAATFQDWHLSRSVGKHDSRQLHRNCVAAEQVFAGAKERLTTASGVIIPRVRAWLALDRGEDKDAMESFEMVADALWWCGGASVEEALEEAILFAAGIGDKSACKRLWHKAKLLALEDEGQADLSDKDICNLAAGSVLRFRKPATKRHGKHPARELLPTDKPLCSLDKLIRDELKGKGSPSKRYWKHGRMTPLMAHILWGSADNVRELLAHRHDVNIWVEKTGLTALHCALWVLRHTGDATKLDLVLEKRPSAETVNKPYGDSARTPLWDAIETCRPDIVERLLDLKAEVGEPCGIGHLPLFATLVHWNMRTPQGRAAMRQERLSGEWPSNNSLLRSLGIAFDSGALELIRNLDSISWDRDPCAQVAHQTFLLLNEAEKDGLRAIARLLLDRGAEPNKESGVKFYDAYLTPTLYAMEIGDHGLIRLLLEHGGQNRLPSKSAQ